MKVLHSTRFLCLHTLIQLLLRKFYFCFVSHYSISLRPIASFEQFTNESYALSNTVCCKNGWVHKHPCNCILCTFDCLCSSTSWSQGDCTIAEGELGTVAHVWAWCLNWCAHFRIGHMASNILSSSSSTQVKKKALLVHTASSLRCCTLCGCIVVATVKD